MIKTPVSHKDSGVLEMWAGLECTINRVGDRYANQCDLNGHFTRPEDLRAFANLGIKKIRYPVLWETVAPQSLADCENDSAWSQSDQSLSGLRELGVEPIVGLLHHGSGPVYTDLLDPEFPAKFAQYALQVATRYPWVEWYTPVNEPLTTARFSALYGVWYPHHRTDDSFARALYNECKGTALAMKAIRSVNPNAKLLQTDDLGKIVSTPKLAYQARFENNRRWLGYDLLCGKVQPKHFMYRYLITRGKLTEEELNFFVDNPCAPDIIGINHYPLSNRFLDEDLSHYPEGLHGGNKRHRYADVGAVDSGRAEVTTVAELLQETWDRYGIPVAITEAHIAGHREQQLRWLSDVWQAALEVRKNGADIRAVTAWSLLGSYDWNSLCAVANNYYESGVFDLRTAKRAPRPTAIAQAIRSYATKADFDHPVLDLPGYWKTDQRVIFAPKANPVIPDFKAHPTARPILITGGRGTLARAFARVCELRGLAYRLVTRQDMDIANPESVAQVLCNLKPWAIINTAGYVRVDQAEQEPEKAHRENAIGPQILAAECNAQGISLVTFSSDLVFDGARNEPYLESHPVSPLNVYGRTKAEAERSVLEACPQTLIVRTSSFFGPWDEFNFAVNTLKAFRKGEPVRASEDVLVSPTYIPDLVNATLDLLIDGENGIVHLSNQGAISWADWARSIADYAKVDRSKVVGISAQDMGYSAKRPAYSVLASERYQVMPEFKDSMKTFMTTL
jgi:dTDP-4-dehydrorhamnose reductase